MSETEGGEAGDRRREARRWLAIVREDVDVAVAAARLTPPRLGAAGYHLQQAAEKGVKALLVLAGESFRHTHDLDYLVARAAPLHPEFGDTLEEFRPLSIWSVAFRYPAFDDEPTRPPDAAEVDRLAALIAGVATKVDLEAR
jgi:HEPN domain-containing protein